MLETVHLLASSVPSASTLFGFPAHLILGQNLDWTLTGALQPAGGASSGCEYHRPTSQKFTEAVDSTSYFALSNVGSERNTLISNSICIACSLLINRPTWAALARCASRSPTNQYAHFSFGVSKLSDAQTLRCVQAIVSRSGH